MIGRAGSKGFPGKNTASVLGRKLCEYPLIAATKSKYIKKIFVSTDCPKITDIGFKYNAHIIERPKDTIIAVDRAVAILDYEVVNKSNDKFRFALKVGDIATNSITL